MSRYEDMLKQAESLEAKAKRIRDEARRTRRLPDFWRVGQKVRYIKIGGNWGPVRGDVLTIMELDPRYAGKPAREYQVFWTGEVGDDARWWTVPDDVELVEDSPDSPTPSETSPTHERDQTGAGGYSAFQAGFQRKN